MSTQSKIDEIERGGVKKSTNCRQERSGHSPIVICENKQEELNELYRRLDKETAEKVEAERLAKEAADKAEAGGSSEELIDNSDVDSDKKTFGPKTSEFLGGWLTEHLGYTTEHEAADKAEAERIAKEAADKAEAERLTKEAADKAEAERLAKEAADKAEAERLAKEAADKAEAEKARQDALAKEEAEKLHQQQETERLQREAEAAAAEKLHQQEEAKARAEAEEKVRQEAEARAEAEKFTEQEAEKLISEAKDIITNARHEIDIVKPELRNLLKDKKSEDLKTHLDKAQKVQVNVGSILSKMDKFSKEYQLEDAILTNFKDANNELKTTHNDQSTFISNLQEYDDLLDIKESIKSEEVIFDRYENKELEGHNQILPDHEEL